MVNCVKTGMFHKHLFQLLKFNVKTLMKKAYHGGYAFFNK